MKRVLLVYLVVSVAASSAILLARLRVLRIEAQRLAAARSEGPASRPEAGAAPRT